MQRPRSIPNGKTEKLAVVVRVPGTTWSFHVIAGFAEDGKEMYKDL